MNINKELQSAFKYYKEGDFQQAELIYKKILQKTPKNFDALHSIGKIYCRLGNYDLAIKYISKSLHFNANIPEAYFYLGIAYRAKGQYNDAITCYQKSLKLNPNSFNTYNNLGLVFQAKGQLDDAITSFQKALQLNPSFVASYNNLGNAFQAKGQLDDAITSFQKALQLNPEYFGAYNNLGNIYRDKGQIDDAEVWFRKAIRINPAYSDADSNLLLTMQYNVCHDIHTIYLEHLNFSKKYAEPLASTISTHTNEHSLTRRLRIGYVSPDFRRHPVAYFIEAVIIAHDRIFFEVFCYSNSLEDDEVTKRLKEHANQWRDITGMSDRKVTELIRKDGIDILVDLAGHTANNRILVFAQKPAPIQISWIGYLATTGLSTMDYKIVDNYTDPPGKTDHFYTEKLMRLPESFLCYLPDRESPEVIHLPALSTGHITFGSFNNFAKITSEVFTIWAEILNELPDSHLLLKGKSFHDRTTCDYAINMFARRGIAAERIALQSPDPSPKHLQSYNLVDIGLDTFPFNGATTTCEALWMGVPVITLAGIAYHSSVGISILSNVGLAELVAKTPDEYVSIAVNLVKDLQRLKSIRENLRDMMTLSPLCEAKRFTENLEMCYRQIWKKWCESV
jgi:protein O-GlcNAc transferase